MAYRLIVCRILIVEDEALQAMEMQATLSSAGFQVVALAPSIGTAIDLLRKYHPDLVVLDGNLAGRSSAPVAEELRMLNIPFVVLSGYAANQIADWTGDAPVFSKPYRPAELVAALHRLTDALPRPSMLG